MRRLLAAALITCCVTTSFAADLPEDSPKAANTRKLLKTKVTFTWKATSFGEVVDEIKDQVKGLVIKPDTKAGINLNKPITYSCKDKPLEDLLDELLGKNGWGYYVESQKNSAYDGRVNIQPGKERGWKGVEGNPTKKPEEKKDK